MSKFFSEGSQAVLDVLDENSFVILADINGARLIAKIRGATPREMGVMLGAAQASLERQIKTLQQHISRNAGNAGVVQYCDGLHFGREKAPYNEGLGIRDVPKPESDHG